jgi:hypothetical protein
VDDEGGDDELVLDERARTGAPVAYAFGAGRLKRSRSDDLGGAIDFANFETVTLEDRDGPSTVVATNSPDARFRVRGNGPGPGGTTGDVLRVVDETGQVVHDPGAPGSGVFVSPGTRRIEYTSIELAEAVGVPLRVTGRQVFYNNSAFDRRNPAVNAADLAAVAPDKRALLPGEFWTLANVTTYTKGINGILIELAGATPAALTADDFVLTLGAFDRPSMWEEVAPPSLSRRFRPATAITLRATR